MDLHLNTFLDTLDNSNYKRSDNIHETKIIFKIYNDDPKIYPNDLIKQIKERNKKTKITINFILKTKDKLYLFALRRSSFVSEILLGKATLERIIKSKYCKTLLKPDEYNKFAFYIKNSILSPLYKEYKNDKNKNKHHDPTTRYVPIGGTQKNYDHQNCFTTLLRESVEELGRYNIYRDPKTKDGLTFNCRSDMYYLTITHDKTRTLEDGNLWISITFRADININASEIIDNFDKEFPNGKSFEIEKLLAVEDPSSIGYDPWDN